MGPLFLTVGAGLDSKFRLKTQETRGDSKRL